MFLKRMPSVKDVILDVPTAYSDSINNYDQTTYTQVQNVTIRAPARGNIQALLDRYSFAFSNLSCLKLHYYCGVWDNGACTFQINLSKYVLDRLVVDMTFLKLKMKKIVNN